ncbi:MAG: ATP-dependent Clp protease ATP-binding subunit, partial [Kiritimatiellae bacterium]|nr:ATP-dependent Clp protease ATP-binding subunit [Kiritimatiellia bacterium]
ALILPLVGNIDARKKLLEMQRGYVLSTDEDPDELIYAGFSQETASASYDTLRDKLMEEAKRTFRPELLNRFDETVVFRKLEKNDVVTILDIELAKLRTRLSERDMTLELDKKATDFLVAKGSDDAMGARPLRRAVQHYVEDPLADLLLREELVPGRIRASLTKDETALSFKQPKRAAKDGEN